MPSFIHKVINSPSTHRRECHIPMPMRSLLVHIPATHLQSISILSLTCTRSHRSRCRCPSGAYSARRTRSDRRTSQSPASSRCDECRVDARDSRDQDRKSVETVETICDPAVSLCCVPEAAVSHLGAADHRHITTGTQSLQCKGAFNRFHVNILQTGARAPVPVGAVARRESANASVGQASE